MLLNLSEGVVADWFGSLFRTIDFIYRKVQALVYGFLTCSPTSTTHEYIPNRLLSTFGRIVVEAIDCTQVKLLLFLWMMIINGAYSLK